MKSFILYLKTLSWYFLQCGYRSCSFVNLQINLIFFSKSHKDCRLVKTNSQSKAGKFCSYPIKDREILDLQKSRNQQIYVKFKSVHCGYQDKAIKIMGILLKSFQLRIKFHLQIVIFCGNLFIMHLKILGTGQLQLKEKELTHKLQPQACKNEYKIKECLLI